MVAPRSEPQRNGTTSVEWVRALPVPAPGDPWEDPGYVELVDEGSAWHMSTYEYQTAARRQAKDRERQGKAVEAALPGWAIALPEDPEPGS